jgi:predicted AAA+ superfamily ATPase
VKSETVENYIDLLEKAFVIFRLHAFSNNPRKEVSKMTKIYFWDNGIRNAIIEDFSYTSNRRDIGALWENFIISERMKNNAFLQRNVKSYFWRNYNQAEVDYIELVGDKISAVEIKWKPIRQPKITKAFTNLYPDAKTHIIDGLNFLKFSQVKEE